MSQPAMQPVVKRINSDTLDSHRPGIAGIFERFLRRFKNLSQALMLLPFYLLGGVLIGVSLTPCLWLVHWTWIKTQSFSIIWQCLFIGLAIGIGFFLYGFTLIFLSPFVNWLFRAKLAPFRGPYFSLPSIRWYIHNGATYMARYTFLEFITPSPFNIWFYRMMGMKIGKGTIINTSFISDPSLIEIGENTTVGGSATLLAHYGVGGYLVLSPVKIGSNVTIGLKASIMGGVEIGNEARILPHSVVLPKTKIPAGEVWGGIPARKMED